MRKFYFIFPLCILAVTSCHKSDSPSQEKNACFTYNNVEFTTLQDAVNAVAAAGQEGTATISLCSDGAGDGAVLPKNKCLDVELDLGKFTYTLNPGHSINATNNSLTFVGNDGAILAKDTDPVLIASNGTLITFSGDFDISAETVIDSGTAVLVTDDYSGQISGNINLYESAFQVYSPNCEINVPILKAMGENAVFSVDVLGERSGKPVATIDQVVSDQEIPVTTCAEQDVVVNNTDKHIHTFEKKSYKGTCIIPGGEYYVCSECGYQKAWDFNETGYGECDPSAFVHHQKEAPLDNMFGNIEYYECPCCGRCYLDPEGKKEAEDGIMLVPTNFDDLDTILDPPVEPSPFPAFDIASAIITNAMTIAFYIKSLVDQLDAQRQFKEMVDRLKMVSAKLDDIKIRMTSLLNSVNILPYKLKMTDRMSRFNQLQVQTISSMVAMDSIARKCPGLTSAEKKSEIAKILVDWSGTQSLERTLHPQEEIFSLMKEATTTSTGSNIPQMYTEIIASQPNILWEHETYETIVAMLTYDVCITSALYSCASYYNDSLRIYSDTTAKKGHSKIMKEAYREYSLSFMNEYKRLAHRDSVYRRYMPANVTYHKKMDTDYDPYSYFAYRDGQCWFPRGNENYDAQKYCFEVMNFKRSDNSRYGASTKCLSFMDETVAKDMYERTKAMAKARGQKTDFSAYDVLKKAGFTDYPSSNWKMILDRDRSWGLDKSGDYEFPHCWIFYWRSYRGSYGHDYFGIRTVMKDDGGTEEVKIVKSCNIEIPSGKMTKINRNDDVRDYKYSTVVVAQTGDVIKK